MSDEANDAPALPGAILRALCELQGDGAAGVSLPRLGKRLGQGASVLMRWLALMGDAPIGAVRGPGWVVVERDGDRWLARLTDAGRVQAAGEIGAGADYEQDDEPGAEAGARAEAEAEAGAGAGAD